MKTIAAATSAALRSLGPKRGTNEREAPGRGWLRRLVTALLGAALATLSCQDSPTSSTDPSGGETHFLTVCRDSSDCGDTLSCLYGACTRSCDSDAACRPFPGARCTLASEANLPSYCDVRCDADVECSGLSASHRCQQGACRFGDASPSAGAGGAPGGSGGAGGAGGSAECPSGEVSPNQVLVIGDSFFSASHQITAYLEDLARNAGALSSGERYRDNSSLIRNSLAGDGIASQYGDAADESEVKVVIMNGGGADALLGMCGTPSLDCPALADAVTAAEQLLVRMAEDGVTNVIYVFYPDAVDSGTRAKVDVLRAPIQAACAASPVPCHWLDLRPTFEGRYDEFIQPDGMNPTDSGARATAAEIWAVLSANCIAQ